MTRRRSLLLSDDENDDMQERIKAAGNPTHAHPSANTVRHRLVALITARLIPGLALGLENQSHGATLLPRHISSGTPCRAAHHAADLWYQRGLGKDQG
jgi:hypothetical protein